MEDVDPLTASIFGPYPPYGKSNKKKTESERPSGDELLANSADINAKRDFKKALENAGGDPTKVLPPNRYKTDGFYRLSFDIAKSDYLEKQEIDKRNLIRENKEKEWETEQNSESWNKAIKNKNSLYERIRKPIVSFVKGGNYKEETNTEFFKRKVKPYKVLAAAGTTLAGLGAVAQPAAIGVLALKPDSPVPKILVGGGLSAVVGGGAMALYGGGKADTYDRALKHEESMGSYSSPKLAPEAPKHAKYKATKG